MRDTNSITAVLANESEFLQPLSKPEAGQWWAYIGTGPLLRPKHLIFKAFVNSRQLHPLQSFLFIRASWHIRLILLLSWKQPECLMAALANFKGDLFFPIWAESKQCKAKTRMYNYYIALRFEIARMHNSGHNVHLQTKLSELYTPLSITRWLYDFCLALCSVETNLFFRSSFLDILRICEEELNTLNGLLGLWWNTENLLISR